MHLSAIYTCAEFLHTFHWLFCSLLAIVTVLHVTEHTWYFFQTSLFKLLRDSLHYLKVFIHSQPIIYSRWRSGHPQVGEAAGVLE